MLPGEFGRSCDVSGVTLRRMLSLLRCSGSIAPVDMLLACLSIGAFIVGLLYCLRQSVK